MDDSAYRSWIQTLPSCLDGKSFSEWVAELGEWRNPACHVRRAGRSGTAYKEPFAQIPLTNEQHRCQHDQGELACLVRYTRYPQLKVTLSNASPVEAERIAAEWFDGQRDKYREMWRGLTGSAPWQEVEHVNA